MNRLPPEIILKILNYFELDQLIQIGYVCLRFKKITDDIIKNKLIWFVNSNTSGEHKYKFLFGTNNFVSNNLNSLLAYSTIKFNLKNDLTSKITKLIIQNPYLLNNFNFENLIYLEVINDGIHIPDDHVDALTIFLVSPKLKYLKLDLTKENDEDSEFKIFIDTPLLTHLWINEILDCCQFMNLKTSKNVKYLYFYSVDENYCSLNFFNNLTDLTFNEYDDEMYSSNLIEDHKFLKQLNFFSIDEESLNSLKEAKLNEGRSDLKIYYKNLDTEIIDYETIESISKFDLTTRDMLLYKKNSHLIYDNYFDEYTNATIDVDEIPFCILFKFKFLYTLEINKRIEDIEKWSKLMRIFKLKILDLKCAIKQECLDLITYQNLTLEILSIRDDGEDLDLNFILKLFNLKNLTIYDRVPDIELFKNLIKNLRFLNSISFLDKFRIYLNETDEICCSYDSKIVYRESKKIFQSTTVNNLRTVTQLFMNNIPISF